MANATVFPGDITVNGNVRMTGTISPPLARSNLVQDELQPFAIPMTDWRTWDAMATNLPAAGANDDLGLVTGTLATHSPTLQSGDLKAAGATTRYARAQVRVPMEYDAGQSVTLRFHAGMVTTVSDGTATLDVQAYKSDEEVAVGADICATGAQSINSLTFADIDFTITGTTLSPGDILDVRIAVAINDTTTVTAVIGCVGAAKLLCDVKG